MNKQGYVYILTNKENGTLYIGVTSNLQQRIWQHKEKHVEDFSKKYELNKLVYYEVFDSVEDAISREKAMKKWERRWKLNNINQFNPKWVDLYETLV